MNDSKEIMVGKFSDKILISFEFYKFIKSKLGRDFVWLSDIAFNNFYSKFYR